MFTKPVLQTAFSALSGLPAPRFWPTSVAAALAIPHAGRIVKMIMRMAIVYPARATLPKCDIMRIRKIQLEDAMINCPVPPAETLIKLQIMSGLTGK